MRIIVVDDSEADLLLANHILRQCKLLNPVSQFSGGAACIEYFETLPSNEPIIEPEPSIILLDLIMGQVSGLDVLRFLQSNRYSEHCMVVMLSGLKDIKAINQGYQLGAKTFLLKPVTVHDVVELLNSLNDRIAIEELDQGYRLHWKERLEPDSHLQKPFGTIAVPR